MANPARCSILNTAPIAAADATETRSRRAGIAGCPFRYQVFEGARTLFYQWRAAARQGIAILRRRVAVLRQP